MMKKMFVGLCMVALFATAPAVFAGEELQEADLAGTPMLPTSGDAGEETGTPGKHVGNQVAAGEQQPPSTTVDSDRDFRGRGTFVPKVPKLGAPSMKPKVETVVVDGKDILVRGGQVYVKGIGLVSVEQARQIAREEIKSSGYRSQSPSRSPRRHYRHRRYNSKGYSSNLAQLWAGLRVLGNRVTNLEQAVSTLKRWVQTLAKRVDTHDARLANVEKRLNAIDHQPAYGTVVPKGQAQPRVKIAPPPGPGQVQTPSDWVFYGNCLKWTLLAGLVAWLLFGRRKPADAPPKDGKVTKEPPKGESGG